MDDKMEIYLEQQQAHEEAIAYYRKKAGRNDFMKDWYENAISYHQRKLDKVLMEIMNTTGRAITKMETTTDASKPTTTANS